MQAQLATRIETNVDRAASALFALAAAYAAYAYLSWDSARPLPAAAVAGAGGLAYLLCSRALGAVQPARARFAVPVFDVRAVDPDRLDELVLTESDRIAPAAGERAPEPLVLDDILAEIAPGSRVVRLFDRAAMPAPGQLNARIDRHLAGEPSSSGSADASQALYDALAELRRSLR